MQEPDAEADATNARLRALLQGDAYRLEAATLARPLARMAQAAKAGEAGVEHRVMAMGRSVMDQDAQVARQAIADVEEAVRRDLKPWQFEMPTDTMLRLEARDVLTALHDQAEAVGRATQSQCDTLRATLADRIRARGEEIEQHSARAAELQPQLREQLRCSHASAREVHASADAADKRFSLAADELRAATLELVSGVDAAREREWQREEDALASRRQRLQHARAASVANGTAELEQHADMATAAQRREALKLATAELSHAVATNLAWLTQTRLSQVEARIHAIETSCRALGLRHESCMRERAQSSSLCTSKTSEQERRIEALSKTLGRLEGMDGTPPVSSPRPRYGGLAAVTCAEETQSEEARDEPP